MKSLKYIIAASLALAACQEKPVQPDYVSNEPKTEVAKTLIEKTDMIAALYSDSETVITDGLTMTALSYLGMDGCPMRIWFLRADLSKPNLCLDEMCSRAQEANLRKWQKKQTVRIISCGPQPIPISARRLRKALRASSIMKGNAIRTLSMSLHRHRIVQDAFSI